MSFIDWNVAQQPEQNLTDIPAQVQKSALAGYQLGQTQATYNALRGVNLSDPSSVQSALNGLASVGAADQAKALTDLAYTRGVNQAKLPLIQGALGAATQRINGADQGAASAPNSTSPQQDAPTSLSSQQTAAMQGVYQKGADAVNDLLSYKDPTLRSAAAATYRNQFIQSGAPPQEVDEVLGDLSDTGLQAHEKWLTAMATGQAAPAHPTGLAATQALMNDPAYRNAQGVLTGPYADPNVQLGLAAAGLPVPEAVNQAIGITSPARGVEASAPYTPVTLPGAHGEPVAMSAANFAAGQAQPNAQPIVGATPGAVTAQNLQASSPYTPVTVPGPHGQQTVESAAQFAQGRGAPAESGQIQGPITAAPISGPTPGQITGQQGAANANVAAATAFEGRANDVPMRKANLSNLAQTAGEFAAGPQSGFWKNAGALAAEYGIAAPLAPPANAVAAQEEFDKLSTAVLASQRSAMGLPVTDQSVSITTGATPNERMTPLGIKRVLGVMQGNEDYINAERQAWQAWKDHPDVSGDYTTWAQFTPQWNKAFDPRVFQAQYMNPEEQAKVRTSVGPKRYDAMTAVAQRNGYFSPGGQ